MASGNIEFEHGESSAARAKRGAAVTNTGGGFNRGIRQGNFVSETSETKIFVCNLPYDATESWFFNYFSQFGRIDKALLIQRPNLRGRFFGFLHMRSKEDAE